MTIVLGVLLWAAAAVTGTLIGKSKGRRDAGLLWGLLLGWIGVIVIASAPPAGAGPEHVSDGEATAATAEKTAREALDSGASRSSLPMAAQLAYDRLRETP